MCCPESSTQGRRAILFMTVVSDSIVWLWALKEEKRNLHDQVILDRWEEEIGNTRAHVFIALDSWRWPLLWNTFPTLFLSFKNHYKFTNQYLSLSLWGNNFHIIFSSFFLSLKYPPLNFTLILFLLDFLRRDPKAYYWKQDGTLLLLANPTRHYGHLVAAQDNASGTTV